MDIDDFDIFFQGDPTCPLDFPDVPDGLVTQITDQETGSPNSKKPTGGGDETLLKAADLFDSALFLVDESAVKGTGSGRDGGLLDSPPRIGFASYPYPWAEPKNSGSNGKPSESKWPLLFDVHRSSDLPAQKCKEVESEREVESEPTLSTWFSEIRKLDVTGAGLENLGNTCYLNAVLQCFIHTVPFLQGILSDTHILLRNCDKEGFCLLCSLYELVKMSFTSNKRVLCPSKLVDNLSYFSSNFKRSQQEDAHEFLQCLLNRLENCNDSRGKNDVSSKSDDFVKQVFGGRLVSKLKCCNCGRCSDTYEPSFNLSLEVEDADNLLKALQSFTKVEKIEDPETKFTCDECKEQVSIEKQLVFDQAPSIAMFHLKRFKTNGGHVQKITKHVAFPLKLDLLPFTVGGETNDVELKYELYAIIVHAGLTISSGHYYCLIRLSPNIWFDFDDSTVFRVYEHFVLSQQAYILFYAKEGIGWFSSFIKTKKLCEDSTIFDKSPRLPSALQKTLSCGSDQTGDGARFRLHRVEIYETKDGGQSNESRDNLQRMSTSVIANDSSDVSLHDGDEEEVSSSLRENVNLGCEVGAVGNLQNNTQTRPRSPRPKIVQEDLPDAALSSPHDNLCLVDNTSRKRKLEKDIDDFETIEAFLEPFGEPKGSESEGSVTRKRSRRHWKRSRRH